MMKPIALAFLGLACSAATAQVRSGNSSPATAIGALERVVTGGPFSAESVTEFLQTASDGSHVKHTTTAVVARDSNGRTRYSQNLSPLLPGAPRIFTTIRDPIAGIRYWIDPNQKVAQREFIRAPASGNEPRSSAGQESGTPQEAAIKVARQSLASLLSTSGGAAPGRSAHPDTTSLGDQTIEGVAATGARVSAVVPSGQIGNEKPLTFAAEAWYSQELRIIVMSKVSDPVLGDTTFQLTHLRRVEPDSSLFEVPSGYRITGAGASSGSGPGRGKE